jgi:hypothetical protein
MDLEVVSTHRKFFNIPTDIAVLLMEIMPEAIVRVIREPAPQAQGQPQLPPKEPTWSCGVGQHHGPAIFLALPSGEIIESHEAPDSIEKSSFGIFRGQELRVPKHVIQEYRVAWARNATRVGLSR